MKKSSGYSEFVIYTAISIISAIISFITMVVLTRLSSEAFFGRINKYITASNVVMSFICLGLDTAYIRFYYEPPNKLNSRQLAWICFFPAIILLVVISFILLLLRNNDSLVFLLGSKGNFFVFAFIITVLSQLLYRFMTIFFRMSSKVLKFSIVSIGFVILTKTVFIPLFIFITKYDINVIVASILLTVFMVIFFVINMKSMMQITFLSLDKYNNIFRFAILSSPIFVITYLNSYFPQIIISKNLGDDILGIYSAALLFGSAIQVLSTGFTTFWSPYMYKNYKQKNDVIRNIHDVVLFGSVFALSFVLIFSDFIYLFIGKAFRQNQNILGMLLIYPIILIIVETTSYGINIEKKNEISLIIYIISTIINVLLCFLLIARFGLDGVAVASMISAVVHLILMSYFGQKYYKSINCINRTIIHVVILILSALLFYMMYDIKIYYIVIQTIILLCLMIYDRKIVKWALNILYKRKEEQC